MQIKEKVSSIICILEKVYPNAVCQLNHDEPFKLLIAVRLSAQCTDARVNIVTENLFDKFPSIDSFADANINDIEDCIKSCGLYKVKAKDIVNMCKKLRDDYNYCVPDTIDELLKLPGVGRKTANLIVGDIYGKPAIVCDTHCIRITNLLGLSNSKDPIKVEKQLADILPPEKSNDFCHRLVLFGRDTCIARHPKCDTCPLCHLCNYYSNK